MYQAEEILPDQSGVDVSPAQCAHTHTAQHMTVHRGYAGMFHRLVMKRVPLSLSPSLQWIMDVLVCNGLGIYCGMKTLAWLSMKPYQWQGLWNIPTYKYG